MTSPPCFDRPSACFKEKFIGTRWGGSALISLYISIVSGIIVALHYNPAEPFYSSAAIELIVPFGAFWRSMHFYSSQAFFLLLALHFTAVVWDNTHYYSRSTWIRLSLSIPVSLLLLFGGYILRFDATGEAAGLIAENILLSIPVAGKWLNSLLFSLTTDGLKKVYTHHLAGFMILGGWCLWPHLRRYSTRWRDNLAVITLVLSLSVLLAAPIEPARLGLLHISGPWFFLGLQEILRTVHPFWAGIVLPAVFIAGLLWLPHKGKGRIYVLAGTGAWLVLYAIFSIMGFLRS
ncbi:MAG: hypothetical protein Kow0089_17750 [Desulfobulbaceae bacterium]